MERNPLAEMLLANALVDGDALDLAIDTAEAENRPLLSVLVERGVVDDSMAAKMLSSALNLYRVDLDQRVIDDSVLEEITPQIAHHYRLVPVGLKRTADVDQLYVAVSDPTGPALAAIQTQTSKQIIPLVATEGALERVLQRCYPGNYDRLSEDSGGMTAAELADVVVGHVVVGDVIDDRPVADRGGSEWLTASTQEVLEIYAPTLHVPKPVSPSSAASDDDWLRQRLERAQGTPVHGSFPPPVEAVEAPRAPAVPAVPVVPHALHALVDDGPGEVPARVTMETPIQAAPMSVERIETLDDDSIPIRTGQGAYRIGTAPRNSLQAATPRPREPTLPSSSLPSLEPMNLETLVPLNGQAGLRADAAVTLVCEDQNVRLRLRTSLGDVLDGLYDHKAIGDAMGVLEAGTVRRVVLLYPRADAPLVAALRTLRNLPQPPSVLVVSRNRAFEVMRGVDLRIDPPDSLAMLPETVFDGLQHLGTRS